MDTSKQIIASLKNNQRAILWDHNITVIGDVVAWFSNKKENERVDWRVLLMGASFHYSISVLNEIRNNWELPCIEAGREFISGRHGWVRAMVDCQRMQGQYATHALWVMMHGDHDVWAQVLHMLVPGAMILGVQPPAMAWPHLIVKEEAR